MRHRVVTKQPFEYRYLLNTVCKNLGQIEVFITPGHIDADCKRDVHAYGSRNIYIAGNTFNDSTKISKYLHVKEGESIEVGTMKNGTVALNAFNGNDNSDDKIHFDGKDEGTCDVTILAGQGIVESNVKVSNVTFDLPACSTTKPNVIN
ncbi:hypothetical protein [Thalassotalea sp. PLHSN55]|uniref:hypothetical protein n=1 Tax=Thalassotalea sp. PLHSN55 TaxID=3435888 RepID=UPI003F8291A2